jgi:diaminopimelate epimerase
LLILHKLHALGNDFLVFALGQPRADAFLKRPEFFAQKLCHRRRGIGADGVIGLEALNSDNADYRMMLWNTDGSRAEISGNGLHCVAACIRRVIGWDKQMLRVMTDAGMRVICFLSTSGPETRCAIQMGTPVFAPELIPFQTQPALRPPLVDVVLEVDKKAVTATVLSMGNPHCTLLVPDVKAAPVDVLGPQLERHPAFPKRTNVEFVQVLDRHTLAARFWERGVGETAASGTGACAAAVAAMLKHLVERQVTIITEQGSLEVVWDASSGEVTLIGSAHYVGQVGWALPDLDEVHGTEMNLAG